MRGIELNRHLECPKVSAVAARGNQDSVEHREPQVLSVFQRCLRRRVGSGLSLEEELELALEVGEGPHRGGRALWLSWQH